MMPAVILPTVGANSSEFSFQGMGLSPGGLKIVVVSDPAVAAILTPLPLWPNSANRCYVPPRCSHPCDCRVVASSSLSPGHLMAMSSQAVPCLILLVSSLNIAQNTKITSL